MSFKDVLNNIIKENDIKVISSKDLSKYLQKDQTNIQRLVNYHKIPVLKKGLYLLDKNISKYEIAFEIDKNSYISLDTALYHYWFIPELVLPVYSITLKEPREISNEMWNFVYKHIKKELFFGYNFSDDFSYRIADKEKTIIDYFYFSKLRVTKNIIESINKWKFNTDWVKNIITWFQEERFQNLDLINFKKLFRYAKKVNEKVYSMSKLLEYYYNSDEYEDFL